MQKRLLEEVNLVVMRACEAAGAEIEIILYGSTYDPLWRNLKNLGPENDQIILSYNFEWRYKYPKEGSVGYLVPKYDQLRVTAEVEKS